MAIPGGLKYSTSVGLSAYELARDGHTDAAVARILGVSYTTFAKWAKHKPDMVLFLARARAWKPKQAKVQEFIFSKLSERTRVLWEKMKEKVPLPDNPEERAEALLAGPSDRDKQHIYIAALVHHKFNHATAAREAKVDPKVVKDEWMRDADFLVLVEELQAAKKDFYVDALDTLVEKGDSPATIFVNKTINSDRGFREVKGIEMSGKVQHTHEPFNLQPILDRMSLAARREFILASEEVEKEREGVSLLPPPSQPASTTHQQIIDVEVLS